ncbi:MAG: hypothetical protein HYU63_00960 [Armatimonadetes bacterium]|nr:hypothetical protein [Armatimonadota bacterium]
MRSKRKELKNTEVIVLGTLHEYHKNSKEYNLKKLIQIIKKINPAVICVELSKKDFNLDGSLKKQRTKIEYSQIIPLAKAKKWEIVTLEPDEPAWSELIESDKKYMKELENDPIEKAKGELYLRLLKNTFDFLIKNYWGDARSINLKLVDLILVFHGCAAKMVKNFNLKAWENWSEAFFKRIKNTVEIYPRQKILVLVGIEYKHYIEQKLNALKDIKLVPTEEYL